MDKLSIEAVIAEFHAFNARFNSVMLATVSADGFADASYAPTIQYQGKFHLYISELARHTQNLFNQPVVSLLFMEPENEANVFRRQRSMIRCEARVISRDTTQWAIILDKYEEKLGKMMRHLRDMKDFHLFELTPVNATYVRGFAQAYQLSGDQLQGIESVKVAE
jgi:putative heme iron utilization protein